MTRLTTYLLNVFEQLLYLVKFPSVLKYQMLIQKGWWAVFMNLSILTFVVAISETPTLPSRLGMHRTTA